uniref:Subtilisin-like protease fibronectin type-III domain-containing protein n=1 Tax=Setaria viridis TaxID=4556 RepID=A0A4U6TB77_SETVI|nr:hypothetical protein SEVIR_9G285900v2 [Setaria viridis]
MSSFSYLLLQVLSSTILFSPAPALSYINSDVSFHHPETDMGHRHWHESFLPNTLTDSGKPRLVHSYMEVLSGFAARLTDSKLDAVARRPGFVCAFPERTLATMHSPAFLGLTRGIGFWNDVGYMKGVIVSLLDSGIHAPHPSFDNHGVMPPPARWKGACEGSNAWYNNKLIGAKSFIAGGDTGDDIGHGTHTASTAVGNFLASASRDGLAAGMAVGTAPTRRVDVLSLSLGGTKSLEFDQDPIAIGAFSAVLKGIPVVCAAGNIGPTASSVVNDAPFPADVQLLKGPRVVGETLTQATNSSSKPYPLLYSEEQQHCDYSAEDSSIAGKIVVCEANGGLADKSIIRDLRSAAAGGVVLINADINGYTTVLRDYGPGVMQVTAADEINITDYATLTNNHSAATFTFNNTEIGVRSSPTVASFSGRGPSTSFNIISGTSMAMPHTSGIAALVKSAHPDWSPVAIKSAILTTSDAVDKNGKLILDEQRKRAGAHATGAEHVNPTRAADPGVVYDLGVPEYAGYICALLGDRALATIVRNSSLSCSGLLKTPEVQLNYPTITVPLQPTPFTVNRTVTNVGPAESTYMVKVDVPGSLTVHISPLTLVFSRAGEKKTFSVTVSGQGADGQAVVDGSLSWVSGNHVVRSPIVAIFGLARPRLMS